MDMPDSHHTGRPPATPVYILRGHATAVHALHFYHQNQRLISGDADGWVIVWDTATKRPVTAWKAHKGAILNVRGFGCVSNDVSSENTIENRIFTHGRDNALRVWRLNTNDEESLDKSLPIEVGEASKERRDPWLIYSITVNALNFCGFSAAFSPDHAISNPEAVQREPLATASCESEAHKDSEVLIAVPNAMNTGGIDIFHLAFQKRMSIIYADKAIKTGMVMALEIFFSSCGDLYVVSGYEDGHVMVHVQHGPVEFNDMETSWTWSWERVYLSRAHSQPVLSLDISPSHDGYFFTSSADALIVKHPLSIKGKGSNSEANAPLKVVNTKHAGQQGLRIRSDEMILATSGWDGRARVYSCKTMKELAVLKWHQEGCYTIALAKIEMAETTVKPAASVAEEMPGGSPLIKKSQPGSLAVIKQARSRKAQITHWIAVGSKDGKISLWDIY